MSAKHDSNPVDWYEYSKLGSSATIMGNFTSLTGNSLSISGFGTVSGCGCSSTRGCRNQLVVMAITRGACYMLLASCAVGMTV